MLHQKKMVKIDLFIVLYNLLLIFLIFDFAEEDYEEDIVEPEPEPEHSSLANMLNNDDDGDEYYGYDDEY